MRVRYKALGAAGSVTGSRHLLEIDGFNLLLDCGLFQGIKALRLRNWEEFPHDPKEIDAIVLSHAHIDHSGYLPKLVKEGFSGPIFCTKATDELLRIMLLDSAKLQEEEAEWAHKKGYSRHENPKALYTEKDAALVFPQISPIAFNEEIEIHENVILKFLNAGHILGAAITELVLKGSTQEKKLIYTGDLGREKDPLLMKAALVEEADILFTESTYGDRESEPQNVLKELGRKIRESIDKGILIIPAFSVGRTQNILYFIRELMESGEIPKVPVYIDSPMAISVTELYKRNSEIQKLRPEQFEGSSSLFDYSQFRYVQSRAQSAILNEIKSRAIIISASGMCTGGRIMHHLFHRLPNPNDTILLVGYQAEGTRGRRLLEGEKKVKIFGLEIQVHASIQVLKGMSAHADQKELFNWFSRFNKSPKMVFIVHGEKKAAQTLSELMQKKLNFNCVIPKYKDTFELFNGI